MKLLALKLIKVIESNSIFFNLIFFNLIFFNLIFFNLIFFNLIFFNLIFFNLIFFNLIFFNLIFFNLIFFFFINSCFGLFYKKLIEKPFKLITLGSNFISSLSEKYLLLIRFI